MSDVASWIVRTPALQSAASQLNMGIEEFARWLPQALVKSGAASFDGKYFMDKV
jgi:hypothetical protein